MSNEQMTAKSVRATSRDIIQIPYCGIQSLLKFKNRAGYTAGVYGWNADVFYIDGVTIVTGYRPFGNIKPDYKLIDRYEHAAREALDDWKTAPEVVNNLLLEFVQAALA